MSPKPSPIPPDTTHILGVDPGITGALALVDVTLPPAKIVNVWDMPRTDTDLDLATLADTLHLIASHHPGVLAIVEKVHSMPRQAGAFSFGFYTGCVHGALATAGIPIITVPPAVWKPRVGLVRRPEETQDKFKDRSRELAGALFPQHTDQFKRKKDDGRAESALIAFWGVLNLG